MLDQNTDRMWYVIGAVLIGAAALLIANGAVPEMFEQVLDSFGVVLDQATGVIHNIGDNQLGPNLLTLDKIAIRTPAIVRTPVSSIDHIELTVQNGSSDEWNGGIEISDYDVELKSNTTYVLSYAYQKTAGELVSFGGHIGWHYGHLEELVYVDDEYVDHSYHQDHSVFVANDMTRRKVAIYFKTKDLSNAYGDIWIQPNRGEDVDVQVNIYDLSLKEVLEE